MARRAVWLGGAAIVLCGLLAILFMRISRAHGLIHAAESGKVEPVRAALEQAPGDAYLWQLLGEAYAKQSEYDQAVEAYRRAIQLDGTDETTWWLMGIAQVCRHNAQGVAEAADGIRRLNRKSADEFAELTAGGCSAFGGARK